MDEKTQKTFRVTVLDRLQVMGSDRIILLRSISCKVVEEDMAINGMTHSVSRQFQSALSKMDYS